MFRDNSLEIMKRKPRWKCALSVLWILLGEILGVNKELLLPRNELKMHCESDSCFLIRVFPSYSLLKTKQLVLSKKAIFYKTMQKCSKIHQLLVHHFRLLSLVQTMYIWVSFLYSFHIFYIPLIQSYIHERYVTCLHDI